MIELPRPTRSMLVEEHPMGDETVPVHMTEFLNPADIDRGIPGYLNSQRERSDFGLASTMWGVDGALARYFVEWAIQEHGGLFPEAGGWAFALGTLGSNMDEHFKSVPDPTMEQRQDFITSRLSELELSELGAFGVWCDKAQIERVVANAALLKWLHL